MRSSTPSGRSTLPAHSLHKGISSTLVASSRGVGLPQMGQSFLLLLNNPIGPSCILRLFRRSEPPTLRFGSIACFSTAIQAPPEMYVFSARNVGIVLPGLLTQHGAFRSAELCLPLLPDAIFSRYYQPSPPHIHRPAGKAMTAIPNQSLSLNNRKGDFSICPVRTAAS